mgnify:CR=1 FL=1
MNKKEIENSIDSHRLEITTATGNKAYIEIVFNDYEEYHVRPYANNGSGETYLEGHSYYTDDKDDAIGTAQLMIKEYETKGVRYSA